MKKILHPAVVKWAVEDAIRRLRIDSAARMKLCTKRAHKAAETRDLNRAVAREAEHYSTVKVAKTRAGWVLRYAEDRIGTGPFDTVQEAVSWFLSGGR